MKKTNQKRMGLIIGCTAFIITFIGVQYLFFNPKTLEEKLEIAAERLNDKCPMKIDEYTRLDSVDTNAKTTFSYYYSLTNITKEEVNLDTVQKYVKPTVINNVKTSRDLKEFRKNNITFNYNYYDQNGIFVTQIIVEPSIYNN